MKAFSVGWRAIVSLYGDLFFLIGMSLLWWITGGILVAVAALLLQRPSDEDAPGRQAWAAALIEAALGSASAHALAWAQDACLDLPEGSACRHAGRRVMPPASAP